MSSEEDVEPYRDLYDLYDESDYWDNAVYTAMIVKCNQIKLVKERGYKIEEDEMKLLESQDPQLFMDITNNGNMQDRMYYLDGDSNKSCYVTYKKIKKKLVSRESTEPEEKMVVGADNNLTELFIISNGPLSSKALSNLTMLKKVKIIPLNEKHLTIVPMEHYLYNEHEKMTSSEKEQVLSDLGATCTSVGKFNPDHILCTWKNFKRGDMLRIKCNKNFTGSLVSKKILYRCLSKS